MSNVDSILSELGFSVDIAEIIADGDAPRILGDDGNLEDQETSLRRFRKEAEGLIKEIGKHTLLPKNAETFQKLTTRFGTIPPNIPDYIPELRYLEDTVNDAEFTSRRAWSSVRTDDPEETEFYLGRTMRTIRGLIKKMGKYTLLPTDAETFQSLTTRFAAIRPAKRLSA